MFKVDSYLTAKELLEWNISLHLQLETRSVHEHEVFLEAGQSCPYFYYVLKGLLRVYYYDLNGHEMTHWFSAEDTMITSPFSFFKNEPNILYFEALEDTELILITREQFNKIASKFKSTDERLRNLYADFAMVLSRRIMSVHTEPAEERYLKLMEEHPYLFQKAQLTHIASYLGITPQSLSRIRKNLMG